MTDPFDLDALPESAPSRSAPTRPAPYLANLNPEQRTAVESLDGPVLVLAGAGTGKTRVLTTRLAHLLNLGRAYPSQILAVTFTNKAAREMQERVGHAIGGSAEGMPWLGTFHAVAAKILRRHAELVGLKSNFTILDTDDQIRVIKQVLELARLDDKRWPPKLFASLLDQWKNRGLTPQKLSAADAQAFADGRAAELYAGYQERLRTLNAADFGDLLLHNLTIFQNHPDILADYQRRFRYVLVDEYQDTNVSQYLWLRLLAQAHKNICCVGDDDQSIYGWRGAEVGNILRFETDFPGAAIIRLEQNYRSTPEILGAASGLIAANKGRLGKTLWTTAPAGEKVRVRGVWDGPEEARVVTDEIESLRARGDKLSQTAVLVRAGFQTREFEERFLTVGLPYRIVGGARFYERLEIRDALAYLRLIQQGDDDLAFERVINTPKRGIGKVALQKLYAVSRDLRVPLLRAAEMLGETEDLTGAARRSIMTFANDIRRWRDLRDTVGHMQLAETVLEESGYVAMWQQDKSAEAPGRLENLAELMRAMEGFDNLGGFLEHVSLVMDNEQNNHGDKVSVMTLHSAKGLEFDSVFLPGWEEGLFPNQRALDDGGLASLEEERRLAYVGITRARKRAIILHAANRLVYGQWQSSLPSRFINEMPGEFIEIESNPGLYRGSMSRGYGRGAEDNDSAPWDSGAKDSGSSWGQTTGQFSSRPSSSANWSQPPRRAMSPGRFGGGRVIDAKPLAPAEGAAFRIGDRVFHDKFGYGQVIAIDGTKLEIEFEQGTAKKVMAGFVKPA
ncbi:ATP-dependent helicase [Govanella unica]|uniref:DNA 3'-5' helicase n=1 Tax=Govanella unica TaxID=2975056 RepID=A0A9X3Z8I6_9PROT|nr:UvrD-helicase domain-containing protein [Govania unica]MDA5195091.1 UvrD-helicase domain-containing protein [Govania unica]